MTYPRSRTAWGPAHAPADGAGPLMRKGGSLSGTAPDVKRDPNFTRMPAGVPLSTIENATGFAHANARADTVRSDAVLIAVAVAHRRPFEVRVLALEDPSEGSEELHIEDSVGGAHP